MRVYQRWGIWVLIGQQGTETKAVVVSFEELQELQGLKSGSGGLDGHEVGIQSVREGLWWRWEAET